MGTDRGSREEIARRTEEKSYASFVRHLMFLPTVKEIREAVATVPGLHPPKLERVILSLVTEWRSEGRHADSQLLDYVKTLIDPFLPAPAQDASPIIGTGSLMAVLLRAPNALRMRTALVAHRELVNRDLLDAAHAELGRMQPSPSKELCLAMYLIARVMDDRKETVTGLLMWGAFCRQSRALGQADRHFRQAAELAKDLNDPPTRLAIIAAQAGLYRAMDRYQEACATLEEGLKLAEDEDDAPLIASFADGLASCCRALGRTAKALDAVSRLIPVADQFPGRKSRALNFRGLLYEDLGRYEIGAIDYAAAAKAAAFEGDRAQQFVAMNNAAASLLKRGMSREGYHAFQDILRQSEQWANPRMVASTHNNLGTALSQMEHYADARAEYGKALAAKINSHDSFGEVTAALGLGHCEEKLGNPEAAKAFFTLAMIPAMESGDASLIGQVQLASTDDEKDEDLEGRLQSLRWARDLTRHQAAPLIEAMLVRRIAALLRRAGRIDEAIEECRGLLQSSSGESEFAGLQSVSVEYAALIGSREESWPEGFRLLLQRLRAAEKQMDETLIDARLGEIAASVRPVYGALLELLAAPWAGRVEDRSPAMFGFDLHESAKARSLLAHLSAAAALVPPADVSAELRQMESELLADERRWQEGQVPSEGQRYDRLGKIREQLRDCWERMRTSAPHYVRERSAEPYAFEEILEALRSTTSGNTALVSFFIGTEATSCFVVRADRDEPIMVSIPLREKVLKRAAQRLQRAFNGAPEEFPPYPAIRGDVPFKRQLNFLEELSAVMSPLFASLEGVELMCVAPHGPLHTIPLHALQLPGGQYVGEKYAVVYTPSLSVALGKSRRPATLPSPGGSKDRAFVVGVSSADDTHPEYFEDDATLFNSTHWEMRTAMGVQSANRTAVLSGLQGNRAVHISCHAFFDARNPQSSGLILTNGQAKAPRDLSRLSFMERQSYLVTVRDLMRINLDAELVTLSACSSGVQRERNGSDELEGFARALLGAGASSALLAMWNVDQSSSHELLSQFYRNWSERGMPKWKALQAAQREFIGAGGNWRHPYHWAPFSLNGSWR